MPLLHVKLVQLGNTPTVFTKLGTSQHFVVFLPNKRKKIVDYCVSESILLINKQKAFDKNNFFSEESMKAIIWFLSMHRCRKSLAIVAVLKARCRQRA